MKGAPRSEQFDDIYFSAEDGLAETQHVFINGNNLPSAWADKSQFTIAETGFGTGLNFLTAWKLFEDTATPIQTLDFVSFEKFPLTPDEIREYLTPWHADFGAQIDLLLDQYPLRIASFHRLKLTPQVTLTLIFDDINEAIPTLDAAVDCWFLDGFTPSKNPDMWSDTVFENMARLSIKNATYATFTAAGFVRRGLENAGFSVQKTDGFGKKRDMVVGLYQENGLEPTQPLPRGSKIVLIGGGLAGTACAYTLKQYGFEPVIYEASDSLASGASGNSVGFYNPRFTAQRDAISNFFVPAFNQFYQTAKRAGKNIDFSPYGAIHLVNAPEKEKRFNKLIENWQWHSDHVELLDEEQTRDTSGIDTKTNALHLPQSGSVSPYKLCHYYAESVEVNLGHPITDIKNLDEDVVIFCNGSAVQDIVSEDWLDLETVRGQVTEVSATAISEAIQCNIHYGGYISRAYDGKHMIGATFQRWLDHDDEIDEDDADNIRNLKEALPTLNNQEFVTCNHRASLRTATKDRFPLVSKHPSQDNIFISTAFGSHGLVGSIMAAHYLADMLRGNPVNCLPKDTQYALSAQRFIDRAIKKG